MYADADQTAMFAFSVKHCAGGPSQKKASVADARLVPWLTEDKLNRATMTGINLGTNLLANAIQINGPCCFHIEHCQDKVSPVSWELIEHISPQL